MTTRALLRPKETTDPPGIVKNADAARSLGDASDCDSGASTAVYESDTADESCEMLDENLRRFCQNRFRNCCMYDQVDSSTESDGSYVPRALKKLIKKIGSKRSSARRNKSGSRSKSRSRKPSRDQIRERISKLPSTSVSSKQKSKRETTQTITRTRKLFPLKEEAAIQKSAASNLSDKDRDLAGSRSRSRSRLLLAVSSRSQNPAPEAGRSRKSVVEILLDPNILQKEAERMVTEMHKQAKDSRADELEGYMDEVKKALRTLDLEEGAADDDDDDWVDFSPNLEDSHGDEEEDPGKMDAQAMRTMLTALAGREAKEDAVASVANVGASWRTVPHDQLNCCLSMDPKLLGDHRRRVKKNYEEFDKVFHPPKDGDVGKATPSAAEDENEDGHWALPEETKSGKPKAGSIEEEMKETEPLNIAELTREQMLEIHDRIGPWVHHHAKKLDKFIQSRKYTPQYLLNHWNGELSDDDSEVDFEKYRAAWKKKMEDRENPGEENEESQPPPIQPEDRVPTLQENNWFLFPTPMTRSYSTETDEQGWDGQRTRPFSQVAMEGLVKYLKRQQEVEKSNKFLRENPWPPPSRYPPEVKPEPETKYVGQDGHEIEEDDSKTKAPN